MHWKKAPAPAVQPFQTESRAAYRWPPSRKPEPAAVPAWICPTEPFQRTDVREGLDRHLLFTHLGAENVAAQFVTSSQLMSASVADANPMPSLLAKREASWEADRRQSGRATSTMTTAGSYAPAPLDALKAQLALNHAIRRHPPPTSSSLT